MRKCSSSTPPGEPGTGVKLEERGGREVDLAFPYLCFLRGGDSRDSLLTRPPLATAVICRWLCSSMDEWSCASHTSWLQRPLVDVYWTRSKRSNGTLHLSMVQQSPIREKHMTCHLALMCVNLSTGTNHVTIGTTNAHTTAFCAFGPLS